MLSLTIAQKELFDPVKEVFYETKETTLQLEHSLLSISKWESKWHKPFLNNKKMNQEEVLDYIRCMTVNRNVDPNIYYSLTAEDFKKIEAYIDEKMTATWFSKNPSKAGRSSREIVTSEIIYYWMISLQIPFECEKWHLNRLLTLIQVCNEKNAPAQKMSRKEQMAQQRALNAARRSRMKSRG